MDPFQINGGSTTRYVIATNLRSFVWHGECWEGVETATIKTTTRTTTTTVTQQVGASASATEQVVGEFADWLPQVAPDVLRRLAKTFPEESTLVKLQTLTLAAKLTSKQTAEVVQATERCRVLAGFVFELASCDVHSDVRDRGRALRSLVGFGSSPSDRHAALLSVSKPAPAELSSFEQSPHTLGSLSYLVRREVCGFEQLPPFALEATDASLRTPDQQFASFSTEFVSPAGQGASRDRRVAPEVAASMHTSLAQFYDSSDSSEEDDDSSEDSGSSGSRSSSDSSGKYSSSSEDETAV